MELSDSLTRKRSEERKLSDNVTQTTNLPCQRSRPTNDGKELCEGPLGRMVETATTDPREGKRYETHETFISNEGEEEKTDQRLRWPGLPAQYWQSR